MGFMIDTIAKPSTSREENKIAQDWRQMTGECQLLGSMWRKRIDQVFIIILFTQSADLSIYLGIVFLLRFLTYFLFHLFISFFSNINYIFAGYSLSLMSTFLIIFFYYYYVCLECLPRYSFLDFLIEVQLSNNIVLVSDVQCSSSVISGSFMLSRFQIKCHTIEGPFLITQSKKGLIFSFYIYNHILFFYKTT